MLNIGGVVSVEIGPQGQSPSRILVLPVNPDQTLSRDVRVTVVQTVDGLYTDDFGFGIQTLSLSGTSAWNSPQGRYNGQHVDGNTAIKRLYYDIVEYYFSQEQANTPMFMRLYDDAVGQAWVVKPITSVQLSRTSQSPVTVNYKLPLVVLQDLMGSYTATKVPDPVVSTFQTPKQLVSHTKKKIDTATASLAAIRQTPDIVYIVQSGDTLNTIAQHFLPSTATTAEVRRFVDQITALNRLGNPNLIFPQEVLRIPAA